MRKKQLRVLWLDAHLPTSLAPWISRKFGVRCQHVSSLGLLHSDDGSILAAARKKKAILLTKDGDFVIMVERAGSPPHVLWLVTGNIALAPLKVVLQSELRRALKSIEGGAAVVRLGALPKRRRR